MSEKYQDEEGRKASRRKRKIALWNPIKSKRCHVRTETCKNCKTFRR